MTMKTAKMTWYSWWLPWGCPCFRLKHLRSIECNSLLKKNHSNILLFFQFLVDEVKTFCRVCAKCMTSLGWAIEDKNNKSLTQRETPRGKQEIKLFSKKNKDLFLLRTAIKWIVFICSFIPFFQENISNPASMVNPCPYRPQDSLNNPPGNISNNYINTKMSSKDKNYHNVCLYIW